MRQHMIEMNWRVRPIRPPKFLKGHDDHVITCLQFYGNRIVSGSDDNTLKVWSATTGKVTHNYFFTHYFLITILLFISDSVLLYICCIYTVYMLHICFFTMYIFVDISDFKLFVLLFIYLPFMAASS